MKKTFKLAIASIIFQFILFNISSGQEIEWQNTIGGNSDDAILALQQTSDGGYIIGGNSYSHISGDKTEGNWDTTGNTADLWIVKTDSLGNIIWQNTIGGNLSDEVNSIQQTTDGGYIIGGTSNSNISGDKTENSRDQVNNTFDYWILKIDSIGNIQWQKTIGGNDHDFLHVIMQTTDAGYFIGGYSQSGITGDKTESVYGYNDYWVVKTDSLGNIQWQNTIGGNSYDMLYDAQQTSDGGYILGGYSSSLASIDKTESPIGGLADLDYWIVKIDSTGNVQWENTIGGDDSEHFNSIQQTNDGGYIVGGYSSSDISGDKTENAVGIFHTEDYWIVKTDSSGNVQWDKTIGGGDDDWLFSLQQTIDGGYILGGASESCSLGDKAECTMGGYSDDDYWVVKTDSLGNVLWENTIGGNNIDRLFYLEQTSDGNYILGGLSVSNISGDKIENSKGYGDFWIMKLTNKFNSITGNLFLDLNSNNFRDIGEPAMPNRKVIEQTSGRMNFSNQFGDYSLSVLDSGNFSVSADPLSYYNSIPYNHNVHFTGIFQSDSLNDFAYQPNGTFNDLCVTLIPQGPFRVGNNARYCIHYENVGNTTINNCNIIFFPDSELTFISAIPSESSLASDSIVWNISSLSPFQTGNIFVTVNVNIGTPIGSFITSSVRIEPVAGDVNPGCNYASWEVVTRGSYDPNDILVNEDTLTNIQLSAQPYLDYIINFQNTGTDTAFKVQILNNIDSNKFETSSIEFVNSSHPVNLNWIGLQSRLEFSFQNILLPDSNINEPLSHGFVRYRIKPKTSVATGDSIVNNASIYFDFNAPVITNNAVTQIIFPNGANQLTVDNGALTVYPNPAGDELTIRIEQLPVNEKTELKIYDLTGRAVLYKHLNSNTIKLNIAHFSPGVYLLEVAGEKKSFRTKFVKQ